MQLQFLIYIVIGVLAFILGGALAIRKKQASPGKMTKLRQKAHAKIKKQRKNRKQAILNYAIKKGRVTNDEAEQMFCISNSTASRYLDQLEKEGKLKQVGQTGRGVYYIPQ